MEIGDTEKKIYNLYLKALGEKQNRPYTPKKDFSNLTESVIVTLKKLALFFENYSIKQVKSQRSPVTPAPWGVYTGPEVPIPAAAGAA